MIYFSLPEAGEVTIDFYDLQGKQVEQTITRHFDAGYHQIKWSPSGLASGIYLYRVKTAEASAIGKCTFMK